MINIYDFAKENDIDLIKAVDISFLPTEESRGYPYAVLIVKILPGNYVRQLNHKGKTDYTVFADYENKTDQLADTLVKEIREAGYRAISQSENALELRGEYDENTKSSVLPYKKIATLAGLVWIGKSNLLVTEKYGAALSMCTILTDLPLATGGEKIISSRCGDCSLCVDVCPVHALRGKNWKLGVNRDEIVDVWRCIACLKCLAECPYSVRYSLEC